MDKHTLQINARLLQEWIDKQERNARFVADHTGVHQSMLSRFLNEKTDLSPGAYSKLAEFTGITFETKCHSCETELIIGVPKQEEK